jgi:hypothetical protein
MLKTQSLSFIKLYEKVYNVICHRQLVAHVRDIYMCIYINKYICILNSDQRSVGKVQKYLPLLEWYSLCKFLELIPPNSG